MSNEKIYMPVEETNKMYENEKGTYLSDSLLLLKDDIIMDIFKEKRLIPIERENSVGVMTVSLSGPKKLIAKKGYSVYITDSDGKIEWQSKSFLKLKNVLPVARKFYKSLQDIYLWLDNSYLTTYVSQYLSHSDYVKAYTEMSKRYDEPSEKYAKIRHRHR